MRDLSRGVEGAAAERLLSAVRAVGVVFAVPALVTTPVWYSDLVRAVAWATMAVFAAGTLAIWLVSRRDLDRRARARLTMAALVFDIVVVSAFVLVFSYERPNVTWALLIALPFDGAVRYGWRGAVVVAVVTEVVFIAHSMLRDVMGGIEMTASAHFFVVALLALVAGVTSVLVEVWRRQSARYREAANELDRAHRIRDRLMAVTSHEIRGSLAAIGSTAALLADQRHRLSPERVDRMLHATGRQVEHLLVLVDDLLVTGRGDERGLELKPAWGDLESTVLLAVSAAERSRRGHEVDLNHVESVLCEVDHQRVQQVVRNLVENAFKYSPAGSRVTVVARRSASGVELSVADEGGGIPAEQQAELFEPFRRGANAGSVDGVGLGLYVVSRIVHTAGGDIDLRSEPGSTCFTVTLPCHTDPVDTDVVVMRRRAGQ